MIISASTLRFVDLSIPPTFTIYNEILKASILNPIIVKGAVDDLNFYREDLIFGWGYGKGLAKFSNFEPTHACIINYFGTLAYLALWNRYLLGQIKLNDLDVIKRNKDDVLLKASRVYKELGEVIRENEDNLVFCR